jgi:hypothetical protein
MLDGNKKDSRRERERKRERERMEVKLYKI